MTILAVQYLESSPGTFAESRQVVRERLRIALDMMPISLVLIGWEASEPLLDICRQETDRFGAKLFRWHPLLTGDGDFFPRPEWQPIGPSGERVPGFRGMPEFTFVCPNRRAVQTAVLAHLQKSYQMKQYDGVFLDRIRFPSPAANPDRWLACFCEECHQAAGEIGLDLKAVKAALQKVIHEQGQRQYFLDQLLGPAAGKPESHELFLVDRFLKFRMASITRFVSVAATLIYDEGLEVGLDTFSPALTRMVGQELGTLNEQCEWIKVMSYGHALGPSGLPFEVLDLANWLIEFYGMSESEALEMLSKALQHPLPKSLDSLRDSGVEPGVLQAEMEHGRSVGVSCLLAGMELVELEGVTNLTPHQIQTDLQAFHNGGADGLVFSWDLQLMPLERLALVAADLEKNW